MNEQELYDMLSLNESLFTCARGCISRYNKIQTMLSHFKRRLAESGIHIGEYLGSGSCGVAFEIKDKPGHMLKITKDANEAALCSLIKQKELRNVCPVKEVFAFEDTGHYGIIEKRLERLDNKDDVFMKVMESQNIHDIINRHIRGDIDESVAYRFAEASTNNIGAYHSINQILNAIREIREFAFPDLSKSNTMKQGNTYYLIDMKLRDDKYSVDEIINQIPVLRR